MTNQIIPVALDPFLPQQHQIRLETSGRKESDEQQYEFKSTGINTNLVSVSQLKPVPGFQ